MRKFLHLFCPFLLWYFGPLGMQGYRRDLQLRLCFWDQEAITVTSGLDVDKYAGFDSMRCVVNSASSLSALILHRS